MCMCVIVYVCEVCVLLQGFMLLLCMYICGVCMCSTV